MKLMKKKAEQKTTQEKVAERREEILAAGRKFKYPMQWSRHRIVINTILVAIVIFAVFVVGVWLALYRFGMTDEFLFRITRLVPMSVAVVDDENVAFSDYLMFYRSSILSIERQSGNEFEGLSMDDIRREYKKSALLDAEEYTYAKKLAGELGITVSDEDIANEFNRHLSLGGVERSEESFIKIINENFGLNKNEYDHMLEMALLKAKVAAAIDDKANDIANKIESLLAKNGNDYHAVLEKYGDDIVYQETGGLVDNKNIDGGRAIAAMKLEPGKSSGKFISMNGDCYYFVKLIKKTDSEVDFVSIGVPFTEFEKRFGEIREDGKISEYIEIATPEE